MIPVKDVKEDYDIEDTTAKNNILGSEADAVMLVLFAECWFSLLNVGSLC